jgi:hypothetical protein
MRRMWGSSAINYYRASLAFLKSRTGCFLPSDLSPAKSAGSRFQKKAFNASVPLWRDWFEYCLQRSAFPQRDRFALFIIFKIEDGKGKTLGNP